MSETKVYDTIELEIQPAGTIQTYRTDCDRCIILLNGIDVLDIIREAELPHYRNEPDLSEDMAGAYDHMMPLELYEDLIIAEKSNGEEIAHVLCCTCGETDCASARIKVIKTEDSIIWKDFRTIRNWDLGLSYEFEINQYREFLEKVRNMPLNWNNSKIQNQNSVTDMNKRTRKDLGFIVLALFIMFVLCALIFVIIIENGIKNQNMQNVSFKKKFEHFMDIDTCMDVGFCKEGIILRNKNGEQYALDVNTCVENNGKWIEEVKSCKFR